MLRDINKSPYIYLSLILSVLALLGCTNQRQFQENRLIDLFQISEGSLFDNNNTKLPEDLSAKSFVLYGELFDTGELNLMDIYTSFTNLSQEFYSKEAINFKLPG